MTAGWCWQIDLPDSIGRGYVYSSAFISDEDAEREFRVKNAKVSATRVLPFAPGRRHRSWVKNVVAIGDSAGFVEPLAATSLALICDEMHEAARGGASYAEVEATARSVLTDQDVLEGVPDLIGTIKIECLFGDGTRVLSVDRPIGPKAATP